MAWTFPTGCDTYFDNCGWLDGKSTLSFFCRVRPDSVTTNAQYVFSIPGSSAKFSLRCNNSTPQKWRFSVTVNTSLAETLDHATTPVAGTIYSIAGTWQKNVTPKGMILYVDGTESNSKATTSQNYDWDSGGAIDLRIGSYSVSSSYGLCSIQDLMFWTSVLTATQVAQLHKGMPWWEIQGCPKPVAWYRFDGKLMSRVPDLSGNGRHIESATIDASQPPTDAGMWAPSTVRAFGRRSRYVNAGATTGGSPNPWTLFETTYHPVVTAQATGLSNGTTYEFIVKAEDSAGNLSAESSMVEATPSVPTPAATSYRIPWLRPRRISKYRSAQQ